MLMLLSRILRLTIFLIVAVPTITISVSAQEQPIGPLQDACGESTVAETVVQLDQTAYNVFAKLDADAPAGLYRLLFASFDTGACIELGRAQLNPTGFSVVGTLQNPDL